VTRRGFVRNASRVMRVREETTRQRERRERLRRAIERSGMTDSEIARRLRVARQNVAYWVDGANWMRAATLDRLAEVLAPRVPGVTARWIEHGPGLEPPVPPAPGTEAPGDRTQVPLIDWHAAALWHEGAAATRPGDPRATVGTARRVGPDAFAVRMSDDSMAPLVPPGAVVIADPGLGSPESGDYVVVTLEGDDRAMLRRYRERPDGTKVLVPANDAYPEITMGGGDAFTGVVRVVQPPEILLK
jgi:SOS-response transcriptional repressor LexA